jgi:lipopolysaccharide/colanic/teichoic acid biosynthesis glycosyltransferase
MLPLTNIGLGAAGSADTNGAYEPTRPQPLKRTMDLVLALILMVLFAPVMLVLVCLVRLTSRGPAVYRQTRTGLSGRPFVICKIRTMHHRCEDQSGPRWSVPGDNRITRLGRFLRWTHLDELPQLWNVIKGDMSLVGPRPERPEFVTPLERVLPNYRDRLLVPPGITGLAQLRLPPDTDLESVRRKLVYDRYYVREWSLWLDLRLLIATGFRLFRISFGPVARLLALPGAPEVECPAPEVGREPGWLAKHALPDSRCG